MSSFVVNKSHELILQIKNKNLALDATLGNGHDSLFLASLFNKVIGIDIQPLAIKRSKERLKNESNVEILLLNHKDIDTLNYSNYDLILYNLGFLPGSDKKVITNYETTIESIKKAYSILDINGAIIIASYIRHPNGLKEYQSIKEFLNENNIEMNQEIAKFLFYGIISDTNRFLFNTSVETLKMVGALMKDYNLEIEELYKNLYARPFSEVRFQGYISENLKLTENGFAYVVISNDVLLKYGVDASSAGNMVNNYNNIDEVVAWAMISEDVKNHQYKFIFVYY